MKHIRLYTTTFLLLIIILPINAKGQEISTIAEIYDFEVGDVFHSYEENYPPYNVKLIVEIIGKYYSENNDTIYYTRYFQSASQLEGGSWSYFSDTNTILYTNLNSLINDGNITSVYASTYYNGRILNSYTPCECEITEFVEGCGLVFDFFYNTNNWQVERVFNLLYYKKGDEEWGIPLNLYTSISPKNDNSKISIYPNPTSNYIIINAEDNSELKKVDIYTLTGNKVKYQILSENRSTKVDISTLVKGIYILELTTSNNKIRKKIIKR